MTKKSNNTKHLSPLMVFHRIWLQWGHKHLVVFIIANILMLIVAGTTALYPIVIDYAFQFLTSKDWSKITLIPFAIIILTLIKGGALYQQTVFQQTFRCNFSIDAHRHNRNPSNHFLDQAGKFL